MSFGGKISAVHFKYFVIFFFGVVMLSSKQKKKVGGLGGNFLLFRLHIIYKVLLSSLYYSKYRGFVFNSSKYRGLV
jgi:hypothetical protein